MDNQDPCKLIMEQGPSPGETFDLTEAQTALGRAPANDYVVTFPAVSGRHALITQEGGQFYIEDLNSSNGTFLNGERLLGKRPLSNGDIIGLGQSVFLRFAAPVPDSTLPRGLPLDATMLEEDLPDVQRTQVSRVADKPEPQAPPPAAPSPATPPPVARPPQPPPGGATMMLDDYQDLIKSGQPPRLEVAIAGNPAQTITLTATDLTIGRAETNDIVVPSKIVSRYHARLERVDGGYQIVPSPDAGNPVLYEGRPVEGPRRLNHSDKLRIGGLDPGSMVTLTYLSPSESVETEAAKIDFGEKALVTIGRDASNDVVLDTPAVSRFHAQLERVGQRYRVRDLRSSNGTYVNGQRVEDEVWLKPDDAVRIGPHRFVMGQNQLAQFDESADLRVEAVGLNKWVRKDLNILQDISLVFQPREFIVVVGQSGGGKSTLVDAIAGYRPATDGDVFVNDINVYDNFDAIRNDIGYVPQKDIIHMELTVQQALDYAAQLRMPPDTTREERQARIAEVLDDLDLAHRKDVQISGLSGGQQKRVSIGVELLTKPGLFFLDEPTSGLDPGTETALMQLMRRLADQGRTIVLITHATKNVMLADKVVFLARGGYLAWFGPPDEALAYFDQYRSERDRRARDIEFDEIYSILDDPANGTAVDWAERFRQRPAYQTYIVEPLAENPAAAVSGVHRALSDKPGPKRERQVSGWRQFKILSSRNVKILTRDRFSLALMLAAPPLVSLLDVILALVLGRDPFDFFDGSMPNVMITLFLLSVYGVMVGGLSQMREIVKEQDVYRRERLVNLRLFPYIMSKVWVAALLSIYSALIYMAVHYLAFDMPGNATDFMLMFVSLAFATMSGMMLGLFASALAPNSNSAPLIVVLLMLPQIVLGGALVPLPGFVSAPTSTRWAFQAFMGITESGSDVAADACWTTLTEAQQKELTLEQKNANCRCMGTNALNPESCNYPGLGIFLNDAIGQPQPPPFTESPPVEPVEPPRPAIPPEPVKPADESDQVAMAQYFEDLQAWQAEVETIQSNYEAELEAYRGEVAVFRTDLDAFQQRAIEAETARTNWLIAQESAVQPAEGLIRQFYPGFGWSYVDKRDTAAYSGMLLRTWGAQWTIILILFFAILFLQKRKDRVK